MDSLRGKRIFVGLSGGVDSAVSAALLKDAGAEVIGVFIKGWYPPGMPCTWAEDRRDAMRAAAHLQIPFHTLDASVEYKQGVIDYLLHEYAEGRTPNPDIMCNREVKFGAFWRFAQAHGADYIATGHYARAIDGAVYRGIDISKDQSYFLWAVPKEALARTLFPVGGMEKSATRALAQKYGIPLAAKKDSQGICFLGSISVDDFLRAEIGATPGTALTEDGVVLGTHEGAVLATLGERVSLTDAPPGPWYVVKKLMQTNELVVSHTLPTVHAGAIHLSQVNLLDTVAADAPIDAQYRYHGPIISGSFTSEGVFTPLADLPEPIAPGQSLALYQGDRLLGGGIIG